VRARLLMVSVLFAAAAGAAHTQPPAPTLPPLVPATPPATVPDAPPLPPQPLPVGAAPSAEKSLERMLDQLESLRARKADLEKQERELMTDIRKLLDKQDERVKRLGVVPPPTPVVVPAPPPSVVPSGAGLPPFPLPGTPQPSKK